MESVYNSLSQTYFWPKMREDIEHVINQCTTCLRNKKPRILEHPAMAIEPTGIFDRIGIDLVFGLPETNENYRGILVITEYVSKYPYAVPIRSKTAEEVAQHLFQYISIFGPPKILQSDQGTEFNNKLV